MRLVLLVLAAALAAGCNTLNTSLSVIREDPRPAEDCTPDPQTGKLSIERLGPCSRRAIEIAHERDAPQGRYRYTLYFVEFDDQGWDYAFPGDGPPEQRMRQMRQVVDALRARFALIRERETAVAADKATAPRPDCVGPDLNVNLLVYVHGWKHNARADDENVENFRRILREVGIAECMGVDGTQREVIGIYVGWRAVSLRPEFLLNLTFWDRKATAADVAQGSIRELIARIDAIADAANGKRKPPDKPVRSLFIGHSFGGHILLTGLGGAITRDLASFDEAARRLGEPAAKDCQARHDLPLNRSGDMVVLINSAIESKRFEPLLGITSNWQHGCFSPPLFVSVTSKGDVATRDFFPLGRVLSTVFERYTSREQRYADWLALGHNPRYRTHELLTREEFAALPEIERAGARKPIDACARWDEADTRGAIALEVANHAAFVSHVRSDAWSPAEPRPFCAAMVLKPFVSEDNPAPGTAPVLNIHVSDKIVPDHSNIYHPRFVSFVRELYMDTLIADWTRLGGAGRK